MHRANQNIKSKLTTRKTVKMSPSKQPLWQLTAARQNCSHTNITHQLLYLLPTSMTIPRVQTVNTVWRTCWLRVFWININSRTSRRRYRLRVGSKWRGRRGHLYWTHRGIPLRWLKILSYIFSDGRFRNFYTRFDAIRFFWKKSRFRITRDFYRLLVD